jgi:hypothetical protein
MNLSATIRLILLPVIEAAGIVKLVFFYAGEAGTSGRGRSVASEGAQGPRPTAEEEAAPRGVQGGNQEKCKSRGEQPKQSKTKEKRGKDSSFNMRIGGPV